MNITIAGNTFEALTEQELMQLSTIEENMYSETSETHIQQPERMKENTTMARTRKNKNTEATTQPAATQSVTSTEQPYRSIADKIAEQEARKARLMGELNDAPEVQKPELTKQIADADRKIKWYNGRKTTARFAAKEAAVASGQSAPAVTTEPAADPTTQPVSVNQS